jgi:valyl-tRNA synthetase
VWYSKRAGEEGKILIATPEQLPVDPLVDLPKGYTKDEVIGDSDILDTWATSAISPQLSSWGVNDEFCIDKTRFKKLSVPFDLRGNAHEIIRTWDFCTLVKSFYHQNTIPLKNLMISGWCLAGDGTKMSKSKGNIIDPVNLIATKGSDALRYWAGNATLGIDTAYNENQINIGQKLITKIFNSAKFVEMCFENLPNFNENSIAKNDIAINNSLDKWIIYRLNKTIEDATKAFNNYEFNRALEATENFFWNDFCDNYLEIAKVRCYGKTGFKYKDVSLTDNQINKIDAEQKSAIKTIYYVFNALLKLFAPFVPAVCDEVYSCLYEEEFNKNKSVSAMASWPKADDFNIGSFESIGKIVLDVVAEVRKYKSEKNISLKEIIANIKIYTSNLEINDEIIEDLKNVCNAETIEIIKAEDFKVELT